MVSSIGKILFKHTSLITKPIFETLENYKFAIELFGLNYPSSSSSQHSQFSGGILVQYQLNLNGEFEGWNERIQRVVEIPWRFLIGNELTIAQSHTFLVNKIQKVYIDPSRYRFIIDIEFAVLYSRKNVN